MDDKEREELMDFRMVYNAAFANLVAVYYPSFDAHKSLKHSDGDPCESGWFIVKMELPTGQVSNHYPLKYWDLFHIPTRPVTTAWDGHTPQDVLRRFKDYLKEEVIYETDT